MSALKMADNSCSTVNQAARIGNVKAMCSLIKQGHPVDVSDNRGWKPTHEAASGNYIHCLRVLLKQKVTDVNWVTFEGASALLLAAEHSHIKCVKLLLEYTADPNIADHMGNSPLLAATKAHSLACVQSLVQNAADVNHQQYCGTSALHQAASEGLIDIVRHLLENNANLHVMEEYHISPVFSAAQYGQTDCLKILLDKDTSAFHPSAPGEHLVNCAAEDGATPLFLASQEGHTDCLHLLLQHGADANLTTHEPVALPLHAALQFGHVQCVELLLQHTDQSILSKCYTSVFNFASMHALTGCTECLLKAGVDVNARHQLPNDDEFIPKLLRYIENNVTYSQSLSPLATIAFYENQLSSAEVLLSSGANPNASSPDEVPPLLAALNTGNLDLAELLVSRGASVNVYHPNISGNLTLIVCLHFWRGLTLMLKCGAEAKSLLVDTRHPEDEDKDQRDQDATVVPFLHIVIGAKHLMSRAGLNTGQVLYRLLQFVGPITLNPCIEQVLDSTTEWDSITQLTGSPRSLMHCCRLVIRNCLGPRHLVNDECIRMLAVPPPVVDYILFADP